MKKKFSFLFLLLLAFAQVKAQWIQTNGPFGGNILSFVIKGSNIFAGTWGAGMFVSTNNGANWNAASTGLTGNIVYSLAINGTSILAGTNNGIFITTNDGVSWNSSGLSTSSVYELAVNDNKIFAGTSRGVFLSNNNGASWSNVSMGLIDPEVHAFAVNGTNIYAGTYGGVFLSSDNGANWYNVSTGLTSLEVYALAVNGNSIFAGTYDGVFLSTNNGASWSNVSTGLTDPEVNAFAISGKNIFAGTYGGIFLSTNNGTSWDNVSLGLTNNDIYALTINGTNIFAGTYGGIFLSTNNGVSWSKRNSGIINTEVDALAINGTNIFAGTMGCGIFLSSNNGTSWNETNSGLTSSYIDALLINGTSVFAGTYDGIFLSTDNGANWKAANSGLTDFYINALTQSGNNLFAGTDGGIFLSTDNGADWRNLGLNDHSIRAITINDNKIFAGTWYGVFMSGNNGASWSNVSAGLADSSVNVLAAMGNKIFAGTFKGIFMSSNNGTTWSAVNSGLTAYYIKTLHVDGTTIYAGTDNGISLSTNYGADWKDFSSGLKSADIDALAKNGSNIFAGTYVTGVWSRQLTNSVSWLTVTAPNGGESWGAGDTKIVTWADSGVSSVKIDYSTDNGVNWISIVANIAASTGKYSWTIPNTPSANCKVKVSDTGNVQVFDVSDSVFSIVPKPQTSISITKPAGGEVLVSSMAFTISWNSTNVSTVNIELSTNNGSNWSLVSTDISSGNSKQYNWIIPGDISSTSCKIRITDKNNPLTSAISSGTFAIVNYSSTIDMANKTFTFSDPTKSSNYKLISIPGKSSGLRIDQFAQGEVKKDWTVYYDNGNPIDYFVEFDGSGTFNFGPGKGFWVLSTKTITLSGKVSTVTLANDGSYSFPIHAGWNIIGNPFDVSISSISVQNANGITENLYSWNGSKFDQTSTMNAYEGYYIYNSPNLTSLKIPYKPGSVLQKNIPLKEINQSRNNSLCINLVVKGEIKSGVVIGIEKDASDDYDNFDCLAPPGDFEETSIRIINKGLHLQWKEMFADIRKEIGDGQKYEIRLQNNSGKEIVLSANGLDAFKGYEVYLIDKKWKIFHNVRLDGDIISPASLKEGNYEVIIGKDKFIKEEKLKVIPSEFSLEQNYPNPFNPSTMIRYSIPEDAFVSLQLYDITGKKITELENIYKEAGYYEVPFNASQISSGVYLYRIEIRKNESVIFSASKKMSIIK